MDITLVQGNRLYVDSNLRAPSSLHGLDMIINTTKRFRYNDNQDTIMLIGHATTEDGIYEPFDAIDYNYVINYFGADESSPLLRSFLQLLDAGCENIVLYPIAPMSEYVPNTNIPQRFESNSDWNFDPGQEPDMPDSFFPSIPLTPAPLNWTDNNFYERYYNRLQLAYANLVNWGLLDGVGIIVPVDAPFYDTQGVDFAGQLTDLCHTYFSIHGTVSIGVMGTCIDNFNSEDVDNMINDPRLNLNYSPYPEKGKYVMVVVGEGIIAHRTTSLTYRDSLATQVAINLALSSLKRSVAGSKLPACLNLSMGELSQDQIKQLAEIGLNPVKKTAKGARGFVFETRLLSDNTLSKRAVDNFKFSEPDTNFYWSMAQMHLVAVTINRIKQAAVELMTTEGRRDEAIREFKTYVDRMLQSMLTNLVIKDYSLSFESIPNEYQLLVNVGLAPVFGLRNIYFQVEAGPKLG